MTDAARTALPGIGRDAVGTKPRLLGSYFVKIGRITDMQLKQALRLKAKEKILLGRALIELDLADEEEVARAVAENSGLEYVDLDEIETAPEAVGLVPKQIAERYNVVPLRKQGDVLEVAVERPLPGQVVRNLERTVRNPVTQRVASTSKLLDTFWRLYDVSGTRDLEGASAVDVVDATINRALRMKASDIHFEPFEDRMRLRFRLDGVLQEIETHSLDAHPSIISRIKIMADLDIAEKRTPQDGAITFQANRGQNIDIRVSTIPSIYGEKAVLRLLSGQGGQMPIDQLGLTGRDYDLFTRLIARPYGILLIVGPTGSGKSTTLCAVLNVINQPGVNITTIEDPVEYRVSGVTQIQVGRNDKIDFAGALRSILRQDPDIIMVGEVRDSETANISLRAALTGHLVLTTLHTNDASSAMPRLVDIGCEPFLVGSSVTGVLAQRLVRKLCPRCKTPVDPRPEEIEAFGIGPGDIKGPWYAPKGCPYCMKTGYRGRVGVFELLEVDADVRKGVMEGYSAGKIQEIARRAGTTSLRRDAVRKLVTGVTSVEEVLRVTVKD